MCDGYLTLCYCCVTSRREHTGPTQQGVAGDRAGARDRAIVRRGGNGHEERQLRSVRVHYILLF